MRSHDNGDNMSTMVGTVLSGFEYRAQKEKYDNLTRTLKENQSKYQYTGYTKMQYIKLKIQDTKMSFIIYRLI